MCSLGKTLLAFALPHFVLHGHIWLLLQVSLDFLLCIPVPYNEKDIFCTQECAEYRALYEKMVLPPDMGPRVDWARVLEQKQVRGHPAAVRGRQVALVVKNLPAKEGDV